MTNDNFVMKFTLVLLSFLITISIVSISEVHAKVIKFRDISAEMSPTIPYNSTVIVDTNVSQFNDLKIGDIIAFKTPVENGGNRIVIHRISAIIEHGNNKTGETVLCGPVETNSVIQERTLLTKGDDNRCSLPEIDFPITLKEYVGKVTSIVITRNMY